jgi:hypothetical protein
MKQINRHLYALLGNALKTVGTYNPDEVIPCIEQRDAREGAHL